MNLENRRQDGAKTRMFAAWTAAAAFLGGAALSLADDGGTAGKDAEVRAIVAADLSSRYAGSRIEISGVTYSAPIETIASIEGASLLEDDGRGTARFRIGGIEARASFHAWTKAPLAVRRIRPGERLEKSLFVEKEIDVSRGMAREFRGIMIPAGTDLTSLEARNTILEGTCPTMPGIVEIPHVRRGDTVKVRLMSGGLALTTHGIAQEPSYMGRQIRIIATSTKAEMTGTLGEDRTVEVRP